MGLKYFELFVSFNALNKFVYFHPIGDTYTVSEKTLEFEQFVNKTSNWDANSYLPDYSKKEKITIQLINVSFIKIREEK